LASETFEKGFANPTRKKHSKEKSIRTPTIIERAHLGGFKAVSDNVGKNIGCE